MAHHLEADADERRAVMLEAVASTDDVVPVGQAFDQPRRVVIWRVHDGVPTLDHVRLPLIGGIVDVTDPAPHATPPRSERPQTVCRAVEMILMVIDYLSR
jgi:hypothetical protein